MDRRTYLGIVIAGAVAGCLDGDQGDPSDDLPSNGGPGNNSDDGATARFAHKWDVELSLDSPNLNYATAVGDGAAVFGTSGGLYAFELEDGAERWHRDTWTEFAFVHADQHGVVAVTHTDEFVGLDVESGETDWTVALDTSVDMLSSAGATVDCALVRTDQGTAVYDRVSGDHLQTFDIDAIDIRTTADRAALVTQSSVYGVDPANGVQQWESPASVSRGGTIEDGTLVAGDPGDLQQGTLAGIDMGSGEIQWEEQIAHSGTGFLDISATAGVATVVPRQDPSSLVAYNCSDGTEQWTESLGDLTNPFRPPAVGNGIVVAETETNVTAFDATAGNTLETKDRPFAIRDGLVGDGVYLEWSGNDVVGYDL